MVATLCRLLAHAVEMSDTASASPIPAFTEQAFEQIGWVSVVAPQCGIDQVLHAAYTPIKAV